MKRFYILATLWLPVKTPQTVYIDFIDTIGTKFSAGCPPLPIRKPCPSSCGIFNPLKRFRGAIPLSISLPISPQEPEPGVSLRLGRIGTHNGSKLESVQY